MKEFLGEALDGELDAHIEQEEDPNCKNGKGKKKVKTLVGDEDNTTIFVAARLQINEDYRNCYEAFCPVVGK